MFRITILIPFYNEEGNIVRQLKDIVQNIDRIKNYKFKILLVDDGSTDQSSIKVEQFFNENKNVDFELIKHPKNIGKTKAFESAFKVIDTDFILFMDGDYQDNPSEINKFVEKLDQGFEVIIGNQEKKTGFIKKIAALIYRYLLNNFLKTQVKTHSPQFYVIKYKFIKDIKLNKNDHRYLVIIALYKKAKFCEIKVSYLNREYGISKFSSFKIIGAIFDTYKLILRLKAGLYTKSS